MSHDNATGIKKFSDFYSDLEQGDHTQLRSMATTKTRSQDALQAQKQHLLDLYRGAQPRHSFVDETGQIFDCFPIEEQPSLKKHKLKLAKPPTLPVGMAAKPETPAAPAVAADKRDRFGNSMVCPEGTVAVRRITLDELSRFETLDHYLRKHGHPRRRAGVLKHAIEPAQDAAHEYAHASQSVNNAGGQSLLNVWDPAIGSGQIFSLSQQWYSAQGPNGVQTVEVGWQVYPDFYGHSKPVLFTYWTADGYQSTGSYGTTAGDFVQYGTTHPVGMALAAASVAGGQQVEIAVIVMLSQGNWWIFLDGSPVGYYPAGQYQNGPLASGATDIDFGGETVGNGSYPSMGSGQFADRGFKLAAYQRSICYLDAATGKLVQANLNASQEWPGSYTIKVGTSADWGEYFYFGGPGSAATPQLTPSDSRLLVYGPAGLRIEGLSVDDLARLMRLLSA